MSTLTSPEAEKAVLGAILLQQTALYEAAATLSPEDFSAEGNRNIFAAMIDMDAKGESIDLITLSEHLAAIDKLMSAGGSAYISGLTDGLPMHSSIETHVKIIQEKSRRRRLLALCNATVERLKDSSVETAECMGELQSRLLQIQVTHGEKGVYAANAIMGDVVAELQEQAKNKGLIGLSTGIPALDVATTGIRPGELWVIGAMPSRGKSALASQIALANAAQGIPVGIFSLEMTRNSLGRRFLAAQSQVKASRLREPRYIGASDWLHLMQVAADISEWPIYIDDTATLRLGELLARAKLYVHRYGCKLIVVDYIRLIDAPGANLKEQVGNVANGLRSFAKADNVAVVLLSQLSRPADINERPTMNKLKESGDIEAAAHVVLLNYMPVENGSFTHEDEIIIGKQREGRIGPEYVRFNTERLIFEEREP